MQPLVFDLYCGLGGFSEAFIAEGYRAVGFDIEAHDYGTGGYPGELVLRDVRSISGKELVEQYGIPAVIVASPPCQEFSYMAMPWGKAKEKMRKILAEPSEQKRLTDLFNQCFRIQREVSEAAGRYVPMVVENVRGAQRWVGKARWNFGSFFLWGDVPALMPIPGKVRKSPEGYNMSKGDLPTPIFTTARFRSEGVKAGDRNKEAKTGGHRWSNSFADTLKGEGNKTAGMNWSDQSKRGQDFTRIAAMQSEGLKQPSESGRRTDMGKGARFTSRDCGNEGVNGFTPEGQPLGKNVLARMCGSKSIARKKASAEIAKIPPALATWIAKVYKPKS